MDEKDDGRFHRLTVAIPNSRSLVIAPGLSLATNRKTTPTTVADATFL
jgi:hypothetical protein